MKLSITKQELVDYVVNQLNTFFPDGNLVKVDDFADCIDTIFKRTEFCFSKINNRYFFNGSKVLFNHLHGDQYAMFLYFSANTLYKKGADATICSKLFQLNRFLHGVDAFYEVELPEIFIFVHPLGTVLGRGVYSNYFMVYQRCGVGSNKDVYPVMKEHFTLRPGSSILGNCQVEENCVLASGSLLIDRNLEKNTLYIGNPRSFVVKRKTEIETIWRV